MFNRTHTYTRYSHEFFAHDVNKFPIRLPHRTVNIT